MPPSGSSSRRHSAAPSGGHSVAALVQRAADERQLKLNHLKAKAKRVEREDEIMKSIPSNSPAFINVDYHFSTRELQAELLRLRSHLMVLPTNVSASREVAAQRSHVQRLYGDIRERQRFLRRKHFFRDPRWQRLYRDERSAELYVGMSEPH